MPRLPLFFADQSIRTRICETCGNEIKVYPSDIARGKGMFCCKSCAAHKQKYIKFDKVCVHCNMPFRTTLEDTIYCSLECAISHM